jgi:hypothetical protein
LIANERGTEKAVQPGSLTAPKELDLAITPGAAIDTIGRLVIVPKRATLKLDFAKRGGIFAPGTYRVELLYSHADRETNGSSASASIRNGCEGGTAGNGGSKLVETYRIELVKFDPSLPLPELDRGAVLDGPIDDPTVRAPVILGLVDWNGTDYVGYSMPGRVYAPVHAERVQGPSEMAELELQDALGRLAFRTAKLPPPDAPDPFTPIDMTDRFRVDHNGAVWVPSEVSVGPDGVRFRQESNPVSPENTKWQIGTLTEVAGANFNQDAAGKRLTGNAYAPGRRELRVVFQREGTNNGRHRIVIGHVDDTGGAFEPALIVYDRGPTPAPDISGSATVEVWGDLYVRGTAWLTRAERRPPDNVATNDEFDALLRQLAGPFAAAFRVFLKSDPEWLAEFGGVMANSIKNDATLRAQFVSEIGTALTNDVAFRNNLLGAISAAIISLVDTALSSALADPVKVRPAIRSMARALDIAPGSSSPLPTDDGSAILAALLRRLTRDFPNVRDQVFNSMDTNAEEDTVRSLMNNMLPDPPFTAIP